ncbi:MAG TPA: hypothetical protein VGN14_04390 [Candidatus Elarobacter sp.]
MSDTVEAIGYKADVPARVKDAVQDRVETVKGAIGDVVDGVKDGVQGAVGMAGRAVGDATSRVAPAADQLRETTSNATGRVRDAASSLTDRIPDPDDVRSLAQRGAGIAAENPIGLAIAAAAVGFLAGLMFPVSDYERRVARPLRDQLVDRAQSLGNDAVARGKQMITEAVQSAADAGRA